MAGAKCAQFARFQGGRRHCALLKVEILNFFLLVPKFNLGTRKFRTLGDFARFLVMAGLWQHGAAISLSAMWKRLQVHDAALPGRPFCRTDCWNRNSTKNHRGGCPSIFCNFYY